MSGYSENVIAHNAISKEGIARFQKPFSLSTLKIKVSEKLSSASRAQRFNLQLTLKYRLLGESVWRAIRKLVVIHRSREHMTHAEAYTSPRREICA